jgi:hypothetical protein
MAKYIAKMCINHAKGTFHPGQVVPEEVATKRLIEMGVVEVVHEAKAVVVEPEVAAVVEVTDTAEEVIDDVKEELLLDESSAVDVSEDLEDLDRGLED